MAEFSLTEKVRSERKELIIFSYEVGVPKVCSLYNRPECQTRSKAFSMSRKTAAVRSLLFEFAAKLSVRPTSWWVVECCGRKANCSFLILGPIAALSFANITRSKIFEREDSSAIWR